jgi:hypothetical protein
MSVRSEIWVEASKLREESVEAAGGFFLDDEPQKWYASNVMKGNGTSVPEQCR